MKTLRILRQAVRGCGTLPEVGAHPGTTFVAFLVAITTTAGANSGGWLGGAFGFGLSVPVYLPMYLYGGYGRAQTSDRIVARRQGAARSQ